MQEGNFTVQTLVDTCIKMVHVESNHKDKPTTQAVDIRKDVLSDSLPCNSVTAIVKECLK